VSEALKDVQAKTSPIEIYASKMAIYSILVNFCVSNVRPIYHEKNKYPRFLPDIDEPEKSSLF
jgi:hypothetical protein